MGDNPWLFVPTLAAAPVLGAHLELPAGHEPGPFSLAEPDRITDILGRAGFSEVTIDAVSSARIITSAAADEEVSTLLEVGPMGEAFELADVDTRQAAVDAVIAGMEPYRDGDGWRLPGLAQVIGAVRPAT